MKQLSVAALLAMFTCAAHAQDCKYVKTDSDPFNKKTAHTAAMAIGVGIAGWELILQEIDHKYYLGLRIVNSGTVDKHYDKGKKIQFMAGDQLVEITASKDYEPIPLQMLGVQCTQWVVKEEISKANFTKFSEARITAIKGNIGGNDFVLKDLKEKQTEKIRLTAACILETY